MILLLNQDGNQNGSQIDVLVKFSKLNIKDITVIRRMESNEEFESYKKEYNLSKFPVLLDLRSGKVQESLSVSEFKEKCIVC